MNTQEVGQSRVQVLLPIFLLTCIVTTMLPARVLAYQSLMKNAKKFGGKDCLFCHVYEDGGEGWNERGLWLIDQKYKRKAEKIDARWLKDYKPEDAELKKKNTKTGDAKKVVKLPPPVD